MAALPTPENTTPRLLYGVYESRDTPWLSRRIGASVIGKSCERAIWYAWRWASVPKKGDGRSLRLRATGGEQEPAICAALRAGGVELHTSEPNRRLPSKSQQIEYTAAAGHVGVYLDGIGRGFPESPEKWHVLSLKLMNARRFKGVVNKGLETAEPVYYAQSQLEMTLSGVDRTLLLIRNRDTEELHAERIRHEPKKGDALIAKAERIIASDRPLPKISGDATYFECRMCDASTVCHAKALAAPSCRTCIHATAETDGEARWSCAVHKHDLTPKEQEAGCPSHVYLPDLLANWATVVTATDTCIEYEDAENNTTFVQGPGSWNSQALFEWVRAGDVAP